MKLGNVIMAGHKAARVTFVIEALIISHKPAAQLSSESTRPGDYMRGVV